MTLTELLTPKGKYQEMVVDYLLNYTVENNWQKVEESQKPFADCWKYIVDQAQKVKEGNCAMVEDSTVYKWAVEFYEGSKVSKADIEKVKKPESAKPAKKKEKKAKKEAEYEQLSLF